MRNLTHELPTDDQIYDQTHIEVEEIRHRPNGGVHIRGWLGTVDEDRGFQRAPGIIRVQFNITGEDRTNLEESAPGADTAPTRIRDPMQRYENGIVRYLDRVGWRNFWNL